MVAAEHDRIEIPARRGGNRSAVDSGDALNRQSRLPRAVSNPLPPLPGSIKIYYKYRQHLKNCHFHFFYRRLHASAVCFISEEGEDENPFGNLRYPDAPSIRLPPAAARLSPNRPGKSSGKFFDMNQGSRRAGLYVSTKDGVAF